MIRVLQVIGMMERAGAETFLMNVYRAMDRDRVQFDFLVHETRECAYDAEILRMGGRIHRLPRPSALNLFGSYRAACDRFFATHPEYTVVHGHMGSSAAIYLQQAKKYGAFTIAHSHCVNYYPGITGIEFALSTRPTRSIADYFMACSEQAGIDRFGKRIVDGCRFKVVPNGIPVGEYACTEAEHERAKASLGLSGHPVIGVVGRLSQEKNQLFALDVFKEFLARQPHGVLLVLGEGPLEKQLRAHARTLCIEHAVAFLGSSDIVSHFMKAFDAFIFPSLIEGLGMAVVEAQAAGAPCFCSENIPSSALISNTCMQLPLADGPVKWAQAIFSTIENAPDHDRSAGARMVTAAGFDIANTASYLHRFYLDAAAACTAPSNFDACCTDGVDAEPGTELPDAQDAEPGTAQPLAGIAGQPSAQEPTEDCQ